MPDYSSHAEHVDAWMARMAPATASDCIRLLEAGVGWLWRRAGPTLGPITLGAILNRVLHTAPARAALTRTLHAGEAGLSVQLAVASSGELGSPTLRGDVRAIVTEFLEVIDHVTAGILVNALHAELARMPRGELAADVPRPAQTYYRLELQAGQR